MLGAGPQVKTVTVATATVPGLVYETLESGEQAGDWPVGLGWPGEKAGAGAPAVLKVSQQHVRLAPRCHQLPHGHRVAPPQEAGEWGGGERGHLRHGGFSHEGSRRVRLSLECCWTARRGAWEGASSHLIMRVWELLL